MRQIIRKAKFIISFASSSYFTTRLLCWQNWKELWWMNQEFSPVDIIPPWFSMVVYHVGLQFRVVVSTHRNYHHQHTKRQSNLYASENLKSGHLCCSQGAMRCASIIFVGKPQRKRLSRRSEDNIKTNLSRQVWKVELAQNNVQWLTFVMRKIKFRTK
jgi:hypothetical protein